MFNKDAKGVEVLSAERKMRLDETMTELLNFRRNGPLMIDLGVENAGAQAGGFLTFRTRSSMVTGPASGLLEVPGVLRSHGLCVNLGELGPPKE